MVNNACLNPAWADSSIITFDQSLYALAKEVAREIWRWQVCYHVWCMASIRKWLGARTRNSRLFLASCTFFPYRESPSSYSSCMHCMYILKHHVYNRYTASITYWISKLGTRKENKHAPNFITAWEIVMGIILTAILQNVYLDALTELTPCMVSCSRSHQLC